MMKMKRVLFVLEKFYPYNSANLNCLNPIFEEMKTQNIEIDVLTFRQNKLDKNFEIYNGINIFRVNDYYHLSNIAFFKKTILRISRKFLFKFKMIFNGKKLLKQKKYDCVIACSYPFLMEEIACGITKNTKCAFISYQLDPFYNNNVLGQLNKEKRLELELETLKNADKVFLPPENFSENMQTKLSVLENKYYPIDFPLIKEKNNKTINSSSDEVNFVFTGTFYKDIRTPYVMLDFFKNIKFDYIINLYYISDDDIENKLQVYQKEFEDKLKLHRNKSKEECDKALEKANIIINIGNKISNQTPSKIFEYISLGKPILNFYSTKNDSSKKALDRYPLVLNIFNDFNKQDILSFNQFCKKNRNKILTFKEATKNYKTASEIAKEFIKEVSDCCENK